MFARWTTQSFCRTIRRTNSLVVSYKQLQHTYNAHTRLCLPPEESVRKHLENYLQLSKARLTLLMVLTAMSGVAISPLPTSLPVLLSTALGTALCSASANTLNQLQEVPFDAQMARTRMRPLVRRSITPLHAAGFALVTGVSGPLILWGMTNPVTALLGASNIGLYAGLYTWMKRRSVWNTWVGAVVGAIPPVMGWTACGIGLTDNPLGAFALFMLLFSWQFPHFNPLAHIVRASYAQAGYQMLAVISPQKNSLVALRHALLLVPICSVLIPLAGLTTWTFALTSLAPNIIWTHATWKFWFVGGDKEARLAFRHGLWWLPVILALMMVHKRGVDWLQWLGLSKEEDENS
jgi:protoheme IX farnesyltransferase